MDEYKPSSSGLIEIIDIPKEPTAEEVTGWEDIDADESDEFSANDYVSYIFKYYRERENRFIIDDYIKQQPNINKQMRLLLVDWMVEVQQQLEFNFGFRSCRLFERSIHRKDFLLTFASHLFSILNF